ncbi:MAG TPA: thermonuclease family protein [Thermodesulfobacteriota bacterium]
MFLLIALLLVLAPTAAPALGEGIRGEPGTVLRVVDGDTVDVQLGGRRERLRLIGLNTPETVDPRRPVECFGREASAKAKALLPAGTVVHVEQDPQQGHRDRYGRLLAYLILPDGRNFAEVMIADGYGFEYTYRLPYRYRDRFRAAQDRARTRQRGLWAPGACAGWRTEAPRARRADPPARGALRSAERRSDP